MSFKKIDTNLKVLILCGGKGERLKPLTHEMPKPLIPIKGMPILNYLIKHFENQGIKKFVIAVGYKADKIIRYFNENHRNLDIEIIDSGDVGILRRIQDATKRLRGDFIMCYGDTLADINIADLISFHKKHKRKATITVYPLQSQFGILDIDGTGKILSFREKPTLDKWINIGYFYFNNEIIKDIKKSGSFVDFLNKMIKNDAMYSYKHTGIHITVNTITELHDAEKNIVRFNESLRR